MTEPTRNPLRTIAERILFGIPIDPDESPGPSLLDRKDAAGILEFVQNEVGHAVVAALNEAERTRFEPAPLATVKEIDHELYDMERPAPCHRWEGSGPPFPSFASPFRNAQAFLDGQNKDERHTNMCPVVGCAMPMGWTKEVDSVRVVLYDKDGKSIPDHPTKLRLVMDDHYSAPEIEVDVEPGKHTSVKSVRLQSLEFFQVFVGPLDGRVKCVKASLGGPLERASC